MSWGRGADQGSDRRSAWPSGFPFVTARWWGTDQMQAVEPCGGDEQESPALRQGQVRGPAQALPQLSYKVPSRRTPNILLRASWFLHVPQ